MFNLENGWINYESYEWNMLQKWENRFQSYDKPKCIEQMMACRECRKLSG